MDCHYPVSGSIHPILLFIQSHIVAQHVCDIQPGDSSVDKKVVHGNVSHRIRLLILIKMFSLLELGNYGDLGDSNASRIKIYMIL